MRSCACSRTGGTAAGTGQEGTALVAVPDGDELYLGLTMRGRQLRAHSWPGDPGVPVAWVTGKPDRHAGMTWAGLSRQARETGLRPFLLAGLDGTAERPWESGEIGGPQDTSGIGQVDVAQVLADGWWIQEEEYEQEPELRAMRSPAGREFPGLAPAVSTELEPELERRALQQYSPSARLGLVPAGRPADVLPRFGWSGGDRSNAIGMTAIAAVLRSRPSTSHSAANRDAAVAVSATSRPALLITRSGISGGTRPPVPPDRTQNRSHLIPGSAGLWFIRLGSLAGAGPGRSWG